MGPQLSITMERNPHSPSWTSVVEWDIGSSMPLTCGKLLSSLALTLLILPPMWRSLTTSLSSREICKFCYLCAHVTCIDKHAVSSKDYHLLISNSILCAWQICHFAFLKQNGRPFLWKSSEYWL